MIIPEILQTISQTISLEGGKAIIVGGSVRDHFLGIEAKDFDVEVYGLESLEALEMILKRFGRVELVGKSFGVLKFIYEKEEFDFSFPRIEKKIEKGHRGFTCEIDGSFSYEKAARRRDFTINAMGYDIEEKVFLDPFHGREDMNRGVIRHIDDGTFVEDPLRIYRGVQFCARFSYVMDYKTMQLCSEMIEKGALDELPKERVYEEFKKLLLKAKRPSIGFRLMERLGILEVFPELDALIGVEQDAIWHPEGDVWVHTLMALDAMATRLSGDVRRDLILMYAELCHDLGKPSTTEMVQGRIKAIGHERAGVDPTRKFMARLTNEQDFIEQIVPLVRHHLAPSQFFRDNASQAAVRRLATKVNIADLVLVAEADFLGRMSEDALSGDYKAGRWLLEMAAKLDVVDKAPKALLQGRDLIALGLEPSKQFKEILDKVYELQLDGEVNTKEEAVEVVKGWI